MDVYDAYQMLITCAREYTFNENHEFVKEAPTKKIKVVHSKIFLKCREHDDNKFWSISNTNCGNCFFSLLLRIFLMENFLFALMF